MSLISTPKELPMEEEKKQALAKRFGMEMCVDISSYKLVQDKKALISYLFAKNHKVLPLEVTDLGVKVGLCFPDNLEVLEDLEKLLCASIYPVYVSVEILEKALEEVYQQQDSAEQFFETLESKNTKEEDQTYDLLDQRSKAPVEQMFNRVLLEALQQGASDIHFEPYLGSVLVRYRIDGVLQQKHASIKELTAE
jgi:general secretion pathway protein E